MTTLWPLAVPGLILLGVVVPLWITYHYITVWMRMRAGAAGPGKEIGRAHV